MTCTTEQHVTNCNASDLCSEGAWFETRSKHQLFRLRFSWFTSVPLGKFQDSTLILGQDNFFLHPFQFITHCLPIIREHAVQTTQASQTTEHNKHAQTLNMYYSNVPTLHTFGHVIVFLWWGFRNIWHTTPKAEDHHSLAVSDSLFILLVPIVHISWTVSSIKNYLPKNGFYNAKIGNLRWQKTSGQGWGHPRL